MGDYQCITPLLERNLPMNLNTGIALVENAELLLILSIIYEFSTLSLQKKQKYIWLLNGILIGVIGISIMTFPYVFSSGLVFDTRSILISATALIFPTSTLIVSAVLMFAYRLYMGGVGTLTGVSVITVTVIIGILWKKYLLDRSEKSKWLNIYAYSIVTHIAMLLCMFAMPLDIALKSLSEIALPVMIIYPIVTVLLSMLLLSQKNREENALKIAEAEQRYRSLFDNKHTPMMLIDPESGSIIDANPAASLFYGWTRNRLLMMNISEINTMSNDQIKQEMAKSKEFKKNSFNFVHRKADGSTCDVEVFSGPIEFNQKVYLYTIVNDISERTALEKNKAQWDMKVRQQQKLEAIGTLAGGVAHEINNPINGIMNYAQLILDDEQNNSESSKKFAEAIIQESERISEIVRNLLQFSRQEKMTQSYEDIYSIVNKTVSLINTIFRKDQIILELDLEADLPEIKCVSTQIQQVLMNLLTNAKDALNEKYPGYNEHKLARVSCRQIIRDGNRWLQLSVYDQGNGIPQDLREKIFEPFFSTKPKDKGTGLGLSISHGIIKEHHGTMTVRSIEDQFTDVTVEFPIYEEHSLNTQGELNG